jgi:hypothetical protein
MKTFFPSLSLLLVDKETQFTSPSLSCVERAGTPPPPSFFITLLFKQPKKFENHQKNPSKLPIFLLLPLHI